MATTKINVTVKYINCLTFAPYHVYGEPQNMFIFKDEENNKTYIWKTTTQLQYDNKPINKGSTINIIGNFKGEKTYKGEQQTILTRVKVNSIINEGLTKEQYLELVHKIKTAIPDISLTTDIIVGFPGETEEDFLETMDVVKKVRYDSAFTFIYSKRTGTPAAAMENQVPEDVVKDRFDRLLKEVQNISQEMTARFEGMVEEVLVEDINDHNPELVTGRMSNNHLVHFPGDASMIAKIVKVHLDECKGFYYIGSIVED